MGKISANMTDLKISGNRVTITCPGFSRGLSAKDEMLVINKFKISVQLALDGIKDINPMMANIIQREAASVLTKLSNDISLVLTKLRAAIKAKQKDEEKGDAKAADDGAKFVKEAISSIEDMLDELGGLVRKKVTASLKQKGHKVKATSVSMNQWGKMKLQKTAFDATPAFEYDKKTWKNLATKIDDIAMPAGHKSVESYIGSAKGIAEAIEEIIKSQKKAAAKSDDDDDDDAKDKAKDLRSALIGFSQSIDEFKKQLNQGRDLTKATSDLKKQKKDISPRDKKLMKKLEDLDKCHNEMAGELKRFNTMNDQALKMVTAGKGDRVNQLGPLFASAAKQMSTLSLTTKRIAKEIAAEAKAKVKQA